MQQGTTSAPLAPPPTDAATPAQAATCLNCGSPRAWEFCGDCGQRHVPVEDLDVRHVWLEYVGDLLWELKPLRTLGILLCRPGALVLDYVTGRRKEQSNPMLLALFVMALNTALTDLVDWGESLQVFEPALLEAVAWLSGHELDGAAQAGLTTMWQEDIPRLMSWTLRVAHYLVKSSQILFWSALLWLLVRRDLLRAMVLSLHLTVVVGIVGLVPQVSTVALPQVAAGVVALLFLPIAVVVPPAYALLALRRVYGLSWVGSAAVTTMLGVLAQSLGLCFSAASLVWLGLGSILAALWVI